MNKQFNDPASLRRAVTELVGLRCEGADNPYGSVLRLDLGPLGRRITDASDVPPHGLRHLTVLSPWRLEDRNAIIADWNVAGSPDGSLSSIAGQLVGDVVVHAEASAPGWDLRLQWQSGRTLVVFGDSTPDRADAWFILGTDGLEVAATPVPGSGPLHESPAT